MRAFLADVFERLKAAGLRHIDVHEHDIWVGCKRLLYGDQAVRSFPDNLEIVVGVDEQAEACSKHSMIIHDEHFDFDHDGVTSVSGLSCRAYRFSHESQLYRLNFAPFQGTGAALDGLIGLSG